MKSFQRNRSEQGSHTRRQAGASSRLLIQCPECRTRFSLDGHVLKGIEVPRFHCSRCDHVFTLEPDTKLETIESEDSARSRLKRALGPVKRLGWDRGRPQEEAPHERVEEPENKVLEMPRAFKEELSFTPPEQEEAEIVEEVKKSEIPPRKKDDAFAEPEASFVRPSTTPKPEPRIRTAVVEKASKPPHESAQYEADEETTAPWKQYWEIALSKVSALKMPSGLIWLLTPVVAVLSVLVVLTMSLRSEGAMAKVIAEKMFSATPKVAPPDLVVQDTDFQRVVLENGEAVYVVRGKLNNSTQHSFSAVDVQAFAFDSSGNLIKTSIAPAGNNLLSAKLPALTSKAVGAMQREVKGFQLKPGESKEFIVALLESDDGDFQKDGPSEQELKDTKYYSARVYSVVER